MKLIFMLLLLLTATRGTAQVADDVLQYAPLATAVGLGATGVQARHPLRERLVTAATAYAALTAVAGGLKLAVSERRPDGSDRRAFPSGHAARAFAGAELVRTEYGWAWGAGAYAVAAGVGALRVAGDRHYVHDVVAGAAIGVLSARLSDWLLPVERLLLGWDNRRTAIGMVPTYAPATGTVGMAVSLTFR